MAITIDAASRLSTDLVGIFKLFQSMKSHAPRIHDGVEASAYPVLFNLAEEPRRVSTLADCVHSDVSTVSRQVSALAAHGLVDKIADPADGRASMVSLSADGVRLVARLKDRRGQWFQHILSDWEPEEAEQFIVLLHRFRQSFEAAKDAGPLFATDDQPTDPKDTP